MKKKIKIIPVIAILFAVTAALVTNAAPKHLAKLKISIRGGVCVMDGYCTEGGQVKCTYQNDGATLVDLYISNPPICIPFDGNGYYSEE